MKTTLLSLLGCVLLAAPQTAQSQFTFTTNNGALTVTGYTGAGGPVVIPNETNGMPVVAIGTNAFSSKSLTNVTIPDSVTNIGSYAFYSCSALTAINVDPLNENYSSLDGVLFDKVQSLLVQYPGAMPGDYVIPNSVLSIGNAAFSRCSGLTSVSIPNSVTSIGSAAFAYCYGLASVSIPNSVTSIENFTFNSCSSLTNVTIPNSVTSFGFGAFDACSHLTSLTIPSSVTNIGNAVFRNCSGLTSLTIPNSVTSIGSYAFYGCSGLRTLFFRGKAPAVGTMALGIPTISYYLPGTSGWGANFGGRPAYLWNPAPQTTGPSFGVRTNRFGFNVTGTANIPIVVEATTSLGSGSWTPLLSCTLTNGLIYFSDPAWTNYPSRFYRIRSP